MAGGSALEGTAARQGLSTAVTAVVSVLLPGGMFAEPKRLLAELLLAKSSRSRAYSMRRGSDAALEGWHSAMIVGQAVRGKDGSRGQWDGLAGLKAQLEVRIECTGVVTMQERSVLREAALWRPSDRRAGAGAGRGRLRPAAPAPAQTSTGRLGAHAAAPPASPRCAAR